MENPQAILTLPSCSKTESDQFISMIDSVCDNIQPDIIATDGDAMRRKVLSGRDKLIKDKDIRTILGKLPLFHLHIIDGQYALYFDDKHNAKRLRCILISCSRGCMVGKNIISQSQLKYVFDAADIRNTKEILSRNERKSVPAVLNSVNTLTPDYEYTRSNMVSLQADGIISGSISKVQRAIFVKYRLCVFS